MLAHKTEQIVRVPKMLERPTSYFEPLPNAYTACLIMPQPRPPPFTIASLVMLPTVPPVCFTLTHMVISMLSHPLTGMYLLQDFLTICSVLQLAHVPHFIWHELTLPSHSHLNRNYGTSVLRVHVAGQSTYMRE